MNTDVPKSNRSMPGFVILFIVISCIGFSFLLPTVISGAVLNGAFAIIVLTAAIIIPVREKHFSFYSVLLIMSAVLFLSSAVINYAYHTAVTPLPILKQIEFSKIMRPAQVSFGLSYLGISLLNLLFLLAWFQSSKLSEKYKNKNPKIIVWTMAISGIYFLFAGIMSIVKGLHKL